MVLEAQRDVTRESVDRWREEQLAPAVPHLRPDLETQPR